LRAIASPELAQLTARRILISATPCSTARIPSPGSVVNPAPVFGIVAGTVVVVDDVLCVTGAVDVGGLEAGGFEAGGFEVAGGAVGCGLLGCEGCATPCGLLRVIGGVLELPSASPAGTGEIGGARFSGSSSALTPPTSVAAEIVQMMATVRKNAANRNKILDALPILTFLTS
jgi:hypothetical protein